jgi:hypothetical protein
MARIEVTATPAKCDLAAPTSDTGPSGLGPDEVRRRPPQPTNGCLAIAAGCDRCIINELPSSHARPEHLIDLRNHPITEPHTTPPTRDVAITARTQGPAIGTPGVS